MSKNNINILAVLQEHELFEYGHFVLPSGMHSHLYIKACRLMKWPNTAQKVARALSERFAKTADIIMAPSERTFMIAQEVSKVRGVRCCHAQKEKGSLTLKKNFIIKPSESVLIVDDVSVSGKQIEQAVNLIKKLGAKVIGVAVIVDRSSGYMPFNVPLRALLSYPLKTYHGGECPLCQSKIPLQNNEDEND